MEMEYDPVPVDHEAACQAALDGLSPEGADLSKPTELAFFLYFPKRKHAELFVACLRDEGFRAEVRRPLGRRRNGSADERWGVVLRLNHRPERTFLASVSARLEDVATTCRGEFDGWEAALTQ
jgi:hypothetical protein